jgi:hypothetical protein
VRAFIHLLLLLVLSGLAGAAWVAHRPLVVKISAPAKEAKPRDMMDDLRQAAIKRSALVEVSEADLNRHVASVLAAHLAEPLGKWAAFDGLVIDLEPEIAHLTFTWKIHGHLSTVTVDLSVVRQEKNFRVEVVGGSYGHLRVPRGLLRPMAPMLAAAGDALQPEIQALFQMNQVRLAKDKLVLDPRFL